MKAIAPTDAAIYAEYRRSLSFAATTKTLGVPFERVVDVVGRLGEDVQQIRQAKRDDAAELVWSKCVACVASVDVGQFGSKGVSASLEKAQAARALAAVAGILVPHAVQAGGGVTVVVNTACPPPPELLMTATTVLADPGSGDR